MHVGDGGEYDEYLDRECEDSGGGAAAEARRQHHHQATAKLSRDRAAAEAMEVEQPQPAQDEAAGSGRSPDKASGSMSMEKMFEELGARPKLASM